MRLFSGVCLTIWALGAFAAASLMPSAAQAQNGSVKAIFEKYDLLGMFAWDCGKPPDANNNWFFVNRLLDADHVQRDFMDSPTSRAWYTMIDRASESGQGEISLGGTRDGQRGDSVWRIEKNRMLQWAATQAGKQIISGGRWVATGKDMPWLNKCTAPVTSGQAASPTPPPSATTSGGCHTDGYTFSTVLNQSATANSVSIGEATCFYTVAPIHPDQVQFTSASIVEQPNNGTFEQTGSFAFKYQPKAGFRGTDEYAIKVCGRNSQRAGCATVTYRVTVK
jgi:Bacterial Ig domain